MFTNVNGIYTFYEKEIVLYEKYDYIVIGGVSWILFLTYPL